MRTLFRPEVFEARNRNSVMGCILLVSPTRYRALSLLAIAIAAVGGCGLFVIKMPAVATPNSRHEVRPIARTGARTAVEQHPFTFAPPPLAPQDKAGSVQAEAHADIPAVSQSIAQWIFEKQ